MKHYATIVLVDDAGHKFTLGVTGEVTPASEPFVRRGEILDPGSGPEIEIMRIEIMEIFETALTKNWEMPIDFSDLSKADQREMLAPLLPQITKEFTKSCGNFV